MTDPDLARLEALFAELADLAPDARRARLEALDDAGLRERVEGLLARADADDSLPPPPLMDLDAVPEGPGATIDRYKLLQVIGEGGFGVVYMAEQLEPVRRRVAVKVIKLGMDTKEVVARFEAERQALALMDHPNIARVLDGGTTASGRPYFVMELVRGVAITEYCDGNQLDTRERLELFDAVCLAVQHAHLKGVIHRDLKPSNVLVTMHDDKPVPKVIDFGVAKAMHTPLTEKTLFTRYQQFIGTPAYMSPEQAQMSAMDVDTRTDVYSLGVLLYELLTGTTPFDVEQLLEQGLAEVQRVLRELPPPRPSLRVSTSGDLAMAQRRQLDVRELVKRLRGDLDWIVMKALEKERGRRYQSAADLAEDVRRHLAHEPVAAGPPGALYRMRKFVARNRTAVISELVLLLVLVGGIVGTTLGMNEADDQAQLAAAQAELASRRATGALKALDFLVQTLALSDPEVALRPDVTVRQLLDRAGERAASSFEAEGWAEAQVRATIGRAFTNLGEYARAEPHLRRALELVDADVGEDDMPRMDGLEHYAALWALTNVCFYLERPDSFLQATKAREVGLAEIGRKHPEVSRALDTFTRRVMDNAWSPDPTAMEGVPALFEETRDLARLQLPDGDPHWPVVADLFLTCGYTIWYTPHEHLAEDFWREALAVQQRELAPEHPDIANTVGLLVGILDQYGSSDEAESLAREAVERLRTLYPDGGFPVAAIEASLGEQLIRQAKYEEAEEILLRTHAQILASVEDEAHWMVIEALQRLVQLYATWDRPQQAGSVSARLAKACATYSMPLHWKVVGDVFGAEQPLMRAAGDAFDAACGGVSYRVVPGVMHADDLAERLDDLEAARLTELADDPERRLALARVLTGWIAALDPALHGAERARLASLALEDLDAVTNAGKEELAEALVVLADAEREAGRLAQARGLATRAASLVSQDVESQSQWFWAAARARIARGLLEQDLAEPALALLEPAHVSLTGQLGAEHEDTLEAGRLLRRAEEQVHGR